MKINQAFIIFTALLVLAAIIRFGLSPQLEKLPAQYTNHMTFVQENQMRLSENDAWQSTQMDVIRHDQSMIDIDNVAIVEGSFSVYYPSGDVNFEISNMYGIDKITRQNKMGYGNMDRVGQYLFPPHTKQINYQVWDPMYNGPGMAQFERIDQINGFNVYVFTFAILGLDESDGYGYLNDVPEKYLAYTDGQATLWVEPISGVVVDYEDTGVSYFVDKSTGEKLGEFNRWHDVFTQETRTSQIEKAKRFKTRSLLFRFFVPIGLVITAIIFLFFVLMIKKREDKL